MPPPKSPPMILQTKSGCGCGCRGLMSEDILLRDHACCRAIVDGWIDG